jgi:hypothetical protein
MEFARRKRVRVALVVGVLALAGVGGALAADGSTSGGGPHPGALHPEGPHPGAAPGGPQPEALHPTTPHPATHIPTASEAPAGCSSAEDVFANTLGEVGERIYVGEDTRHGGVDVAIASVTSSTALARAVAADNPVAVRAAVTKIVFNHLHIVRLRVIRDGRVLADVGGPFVLAPLSGDIRFRGRTVGRYVLSVQDDLGYRLLAGRLVGLEVVMRSGARQIMSSLTPAPESIPAHGTLTFGGVTYVTRTLDATAFPSGPLQIHLLIPPPAEPLGSRTCAQIEVAALGEVGELISRQFVLSPTSSRSYVEVAEYLTHAHIYVTKGSRLLAGDAGAPARLPSSGRMKLHGRSYAVYSFAPQAAARLPIPTVGLPIPTVGPPIRVFMLVPRT